MLSERLRLLRDEKGITQEELADIFNIGRSTYSKYETGTNTPDLETVMKLSDFYNVSLDYICGKIDLRDNIYTDPKLCEYLNKMTKIYYEYFNVSIDQDK